MHGAIDELTTERDAEHLRFYISLKHIYQYRLKTCGEMNWVIIIIIIIKYLYSAYTFKF